MKQLIILHLQSDDQHVNPKYQLDSLNNIGTDDRFILIHCENAKVN